MKNNSYQMKNLSFEVNEYFKGQTVHLFGIDYSGQREMNKFIEALHKYTEPSFRLTSSGVGMDDRHDRKFGEFRPIKGLRHYNGGNQVDAFIAVENTAIHTGRSAISGPIGILYGMANMRIPGKGHAIVYLITTEGDTLGLSNFAARRQFKRYVGVRNHARSITPATFLDLQELGMLEQISEHEPDTEIEYPVGDREIGPESAGYLAKIGRKLGLRMLKASRVPQRRPATTDENLIEEIASGE